MNSFDRLTRVAMVGVVILQLCGAAFAQDEKTVKRLGTILQSSQTNQTGAGSGSTGMAPARTGEADGTGNPQLGGDSRPFYRLNRSDVVVLSFTLSPELDQTLTIQPDGYVMPKRRQARACSRADIRRASRSRAKSVCGISTRSASDGNTEGVRAPYFVAGGGVGKPGKYELRADTTVMEAIEIAGGFTHEAKHSQVLLFRRVNNNFVEARVFNLKRMLNERTLREVSFLSPGDLIFVPQNSVSKVERFLSKPSLSMYVSPSQF
jgi:polysaccharide export outer membrane protein